MIYTLAADAIVLAHLTFIAFVTLGGLLVLRRPRWLWLHLPAALWGAFVEISGGVCPLTPLENSLRLAAGQRGYSGGFIEQYLIPVVYPDGLTRWIQIWLGVGVVAINAALYGLLAARYRRAGGESE